MALCVVKYIYKTMVLKQTGFDVPLISFQSSLMKVLLISWHIYFRLPVGSIARSLHFEVYWGRNRTPLQAIEILRQCVPYIHLRHIGETSKQSRNTDKVTIIFSITCRVSIPVLYISRCTG